MIEGTDEKNDFWSNLLNCNSISYYLVYPLVVTVFNKTVNDRIYLKETRSMIECDETIDGRKFPFETRSMIECHTCKRGHERMYPRGKDFSYPIPSLSRAQCSTHVLIFALMRS